MNASSHFFLNVQMHLPVEKYLNTRYIGTPTLGQALGLCYCCSLTERWILLN